MMNDVLWKKYLETLQTTIDIYTESLLKILQLYKVRL